jgi:hypothetical protein
VIVPDLGLDFEGVSWMECWREVEIYELEQTGGIFPVPRPIYPMVMIRV